MAAAIDDPALRAFLTTERLLLAETVAGCRSALGALATSVDGRIQLDCFVADDQGSRRCRVVADTPGRAVAAARAGLRL